MGLLTVRSVYDAIFLNIKREWESGRVGEWEEGGEREERGETGKIENDEILKPPLSPLSPPSSHSPTLPLSHSYFVCYVFPILWQRA